MDEQFIVFLPTSLPLLALTGPPWLEATLALCFVFYLFLKDDWEAKEGAATWHAALPHSKMTLEKNKNYSKIMSLEQKVFFRVKIFCNHLLAF